jgi:hypothetical protein
MSSRSDATTRWLAAIVSAAFAGAAGCSQETVGAVKAGPCASPASRALDFWLGEWSVAGPGGSADSQSQVVLELDQCLVVERWSGGSHRGENLFGYSAEDASWHGLFADNEGRVHVFLDGKVEGGSAQLTGPSRGAQGEAVLNRLTLRRQSEDHLEQVWEKSSDGGKTWTTAFRGTYARKLRR